jgi:hypothetical protein
MNNRQWIYYLVVGLLVVVYFLAEATDLLVVAMLVILPLGAWVIGRIFDPNG